MKKVLFAAVSGALLMVTTQASAADGAKVWNSACFACHKTGVAGAPKMGDKEAWAPRIEKGMDTLHQHALKGFQGDSGNMPPKGGYGHLSDEEVIAAVDYMVSESK